jgi:hypothetical protein
MAAFTKKMCLTRNQTNIEIKTNKFSGIGMLFSYSK